MLTGIDVSHWQGRMDFSPYDFVIMKASEGNGYKDPMLDEHYNILHGSRDGKPDTSKLYGFYHYARPDLKNTPQQEADCFLSFVNAHIGTAIIALDWEGKSLAYSPDWAYDWLDYVFFNTGVRPLLYISASEENTGKYEKIMNANYGLWVAHYGVNSPRVKHWDFWAMWQKQGSPLDTNIFNGDKNAFRKYAASNITISSPISVGDFVKLSSTIDYNGHQNDSWVLDATFSVMQVNGDRVVVGRNGLITGAWHINAVYKI